MVQREAVRKVVFDVANDVATELPAGRTLTVAEETRLLGAESALDSIELVNLIVSLEEALQDAFESEICLTDERAMSQSKSPFRSFQALIDYIVQQLNE